MTNQEWLAEQIKKLSPEEVYDLIYDIVVNIVTQNPSVNLAIPPEMLIR